MRTTLHSALFKAILYCRQMLDMYVCTSTFTEVYRHTYFWHGWKRSCYQQRREVNINTHTKFTFVFLQERQAERIPFLLFCNAWAEAGGSWLWNWLASLFLMVINTAKAFFSFVPISSSRMRAPGLTRDSQGHLRAQVPRWREYSSSSNSLWLYRWWNWQLWSCLWLCHVARLLAELTYSTQCHFSLTYLWSWDICISLCSGNSACINPEWVQVCDFPLSPSHTYTLSFICIFIAGYIHYQAYTGSCITRWFCISSNLSSL